MNNFLFKDKIDVVLIDWHGILSKRGFWCNQSKINKNLENWCNLIFSDEIMKDWMRNKMSFTKLCEDTAYKFKLSQNEITAYFENDIEEYGPKWELLSIINKLFPSAKKILFSDNPILFKEKVLNVNKRLTSYFDSIILSCDYGVLKDDKKINLFDVALEQLNLENFNNVVLIEDKIGNCTYFRKIGGHIINII